MASAADQDLAAWLGRVQEESFSRAGQALRTAYPPQRRMTGPQLAGYLERRTYALASTTRPDGRAHAAPTLFSLYADAFWLRMTPQRLISFAEVSWQGVAETS